MKNKKINIRVVYAETDQMGIVYYANYLIWFERGRTEFFRNLGIPYTDLENEGIYLPVVEAHCHYYLSAKYDDVLNIYTYIKEVKNASVTFEYKIERDKSLIATGYTIHAFINKSGKPTKIPEKIKNIFT
ncbi:MAG: acyl-CoA thioesterase [Candidatus Firestonebacteria bacterium]|nr:acyl-CoA thioesterase [Candidatus Firestonebacteria bacterium]